MNKQNSSFRSGLVIGAIFGVIVAGVGLSHSAVGKKAWDGNGWSFQVGYINGFLDAVRLTKSMEPGGWTDQAYTLPKNAKLMAWHKKIVQLYEDPENSVNDVPRLILVAGKSMRKKYGPEENRDPSEGFERLGAAIKAFKQPEHESEKAENASEEAGDDTAKAASVDENKDADQAKDEEAAEDSSDDNSCCTKQ